SVGAGAVGKATGSIALSWVVAATLRHMLWLKLRVGVLTMIGLALAGGAAVFSQQLRCPARSGSMTFRIRPTTNAVPTAASGPAAIKIKLEGTPGLAYE